MAIKIGHASIDERGKATGGTAGDQTGKEVCIRGWYNSGWHTVLRPKTGTLAEKSAKACEAACTNDHIGYDQGQRNTLNAKAKAVSYDISKITADCACDCSALMHVCAIAGGANLTYGSNALTTRRMVHAFEKSGDYEKLTDSKYLTTDKYLRRGDILVNPGKHTVMVLENGACAESGGTAESTKPAATYTMTLPLLKKGSVGDSVRALQHLLMGYGYSCGKYGADGEFGKDTENAALCFQEDNELTADGKVGAKTWSKLLGVT